MNTTDKPLRRHRIIAASVFILIAILSMMRFAHELPVVAAALSGFGLLGLFFIYFELARRKSEFLQQNESRITGVAVFLAVGFMLTTASSQLPADKIFKAMIPSVIALLTGLGGCIHLLNRRYGETGFLMRFLVIGGILLSIFLIAAGTIAGFSAYSQGGRILGFILAGFFSVLLIVLVFRILKSSYTER